MDATPRSKKPRTKSSARKPALVPAADDVLLEDHPATVIAPKNVRYTEPSTLAIHSGAEPGQDQALEDLAARQVEGALDANLAELSLGQRLSALNGAVADGEGSGSDNDKETGASSRPSRPLDSLNVVPTHSLTRTLIQALHSSDSRLLESCLAHSDATLIRNTVRRLPPQLALPLLLACVERLGRGARGANIKGGGGGASSQRGTVLITWIKTTLAVHSGHLMTMPDLVARLAGLHATLTSRLALHESLLSLNGKLDMVLSQIEMRSSSAPASTTSKNRTPVLPDNARRQPTRYVEGESEEEGDRMNIEPQIESGDEEGSIEDVELGGESEEDEDEESDEDEGEGVGESGDGSESDGSGSPLDEFTDEDEEDDNEESE